MRDMRILLAEMVGTFILMLGGLGVAVLAAIPGSFGESRILAVALGFGFAWLVVSYTVGPVSGGHVNPAVTVAAIATRRVPLHHLPSYLIGQVVGAVLGGLTIWLIADSASEASPLGRSWDGVSDTNFATNLWTGEFMGFWPMVIAEVAFTAVLVLAYLSTTRAGYRPAAVGIHVGGVLALAHLATIPVDNTSLNPVRSLGTAIFAGGESLEQLWAFIVFPVLGAAVGALVWLAFGDGADDGGEPDEVPEIRSARAAAARASASVREAIGE